MAVELPSLPDLPQIPELANLPAPVDNINEIFSLSEDSLKGPLLGSLPSINSPGDVLNLLQGGFDPKSLLGSASLFWDIDTRISQLPNQIAAALKPSPVYAKVGGISGFDLDIMDTHSLSATSNITQFPVEDGSQYSQAQIFQPRTYKLTGRVGELFFEAPEVTHVTGFNIPGFDINLPDGATPIDWKTITGSLGEFKGFGKLQLKLFPIKLGEFKIPDFGSPKLPPFPKQLNIPPLSVDLTPDTIITRAQNAYTVLHGFFRQSIPFAIVTPWGTEKNMLIKSIELTENDGDRVSTISLTMQEIRIAKTKFSEFDAGQLAGVSAQDSAVTKNQGDQSLSPCSGVSFCKSTADIEKRFGK